MSETEPRRLFITGGNGFIGRALGVRFRKHGVEVRGVDFTADPSADVVAGDITDPSPWRDHLIGCDTVIHTAAIVSNAYDADTSWRVNVLGTQRVLDAAIAAGVQRFVHISSIRAFSDLDYPDGVTEDHPVRPDGNPYVDTKIASEQVVLQRHAEGRIECTVIRPGDVYGPGSQPWTVKPIGLIRKNMFLLPAMGNGIFSPVYIDDLVAGIRLATITDAAAGQVFTIGGASGVRCADFFGHYYRMLGKRGPLCLPTAAALALARTSETAARITRTPTEVNRTSLLYLCRTGTYSIDKARRVLGYEPTVDVTTGMVHTENWLREQQLIPRSTHADS
ncbi:NAD-dependent epimerase/dehydratase family protein [Antrihabitans cavernicola]|uniref:NAD-dependent epimerase/dehydratase family protein n=1 Tax=Antrihabitans cavernicola TaxID=2495913 RepID=A0A5A7SCS1_9NOCA|nr:NAD-dependent epimerase/dehydratase family protein [Spelaeibacter cavernicola]KAA0022295.1 NAD-dependent epimerase/dehydratase family protein [Spelaeibacter cavernicola]